jgi:GNAT superfamily N-acetyltransferase
LRLIKELATYEREPDAVVATEADLLRDGFGAEPLFHVMIAEWSLAPVGFALYFFQFSTWTGRAVLYLEDLFVVPEHRKRGIGKAFMAALAKEAVERGCSRFQWAVLDWNAPAIAFYESLGARIEKEWLAARLTGEALGRLAAKSSAS